MLGAGFTRSSESARAAPPSLAWGIYRSLRTVQRVRETCGQGRGHYMRRLVSLAALTATFTILALAASGAASASTRDGGLLGGLLGGNCPSSGTRVFAPWNDTNLYYLAPNGGLENGATGWSLSGGAGVVSGNEPFYSSGNHSIALPSGSTARSPVTCIGPKNLAIRMFGSDRNGTDSGLHVRVLWYGLVN